MKDEMADGKFITKRDNVLICRWKCADSIPEGLN
jgi:hypothetical protein